MNTPHSKRGGHRAGAGRTVNPLGHTVVKSVSLPASLWDRLGPRKSQAIAKLITNKAEADDRAERLMTALKTIAAKNCPLKQNLAEMIRNIRVVAREAIEKDDLL